MRAPFVLAPQPPLPVAAAVAFAEEALRRSLGPWPGVIEHRDRAFGPEPWQRFDVFAPAEAAGPLDVVVFLHGGGWTNGYKEWCGFMAPAVTAAGAMLVAPTYRLAPEFRYPVWLEDSFAALAAIRGDVASFGGDPDRLFVGGHSAGGQIAMLLALRSDLWPAYDLPATAIRGCCPVSAILDLHYPDPLPGSLEARVYELVLHHPSQDRAASPLSWLDAAGVPTLLMWGGRDTERVRRSNEDAVARLAERRKPCLARCYPELDHFQTQLALGDPAHDWYRALRELRDTKAG
jgi:acetyl esterase/lipase